MDENDNRAFIEIELLNLRGKVWKYHKKILSAVSIHYDIPIELIKSKSRKREIVYPRQICMWLMKNIIVKATLEEIGEPFGKDHATVLHSAKTVNNLIDTNADYRNNVHGVLKYLSENKTKIYLCSICGKTNVFSKYYVNPNNLEIGEKVQEDNQYMFCKDCNAMIEPEIKRSQ